MKIILGFIALVAVGAAIGGFGGSDDESTAASAVDDSPLVAEGTDYSDDVSDDAERGLELTTEGTELLAWMNDWAAGGQTDPATACAQVSTADAHVDRLGEIVDELGQLDSVASSDLTDLESSYSTLQQTASGVRQACADAGF